MYLLTERKKLKKQSYLISCHSLGKRFSHWSLKLKFSRSEKTFLVKGFLRAVLTGHGHPGPVWKITKMPLLPPAGRLSFLAKWLHLKRRVMKIPLFEFIQKCLRLHPALSMCLSETINWIISRIPPWISKTIFV